MTYGASAGCAAATPEAPQADRSGNEGNRNVSAARTAVRIDCHKLLRLRLLSGATSAAGAICVAD
jgi:hypothetical protein